MSTRPTNLYNSHSNHSHIYLDSSQPNLARTESWIAAEVIQQVAIELTRGEVVTRYCQCGRAWTSGAHSTALPSPYPFAVIVHGTCTCGAARDMDGDQTPHLDAYDAAAHLVTSTPWSAHDYRDRAASVAAQEMLENVAAQRSSGKPLPESLLTLASHWSAELSRIDQGAKHGPAQDE